MTAPRRRDIDGRPAISREEIMSRTGAGYSTVRYWTAHRDENGHPDRVARIGRADYYDETAFEQWWAKFQDAKRAGVTPLDDSGDPDELIDTTETARILGYSGPGVVREYLRSSPGYFPRPDRTELSTGGHQRRFWRRRTVWGWARGRGTRTASGRR